jgi:hypothetical protein
MQYVTQTGVQSGAEAASHFEWGGNNADGSQGFAPPKLSRDSGRINVFKFAAMLLMLS